MRKLGLVGLMILLGLIGSGKVFAANGDVLFTENFNAMTAVPYSAGTAQNLTTGIGNFNFIGCNAKNTCGIAINSSTGGSGSATGEFQAYYNNTGGYWSIVRSTNFATTDPSALMVSFDMKYTQLATGTNYLYVNFGVGSNFTTYTSSTAPSSVNSDFSLLYNSNYYISAFNSTTTLSTSGAVASGTTYSMTWVINNSGANLNYTDPNGVTQTLANDTWDLWRGTTLLVDGATAIDGNVALQDLYIGSTGGKKHQLDLDNMVVTDLTPATGASSPTLSAAGSATVDADFNITFTDNSTWRTGVTAVKVGSNTLPTNAYDLTTAGQITLKPSQTSYLQTAGTYTISVSESGYTDATVSQTIGVGAANKLVIKTQPAAPGANGAALATQPEVYVQDQYGNATTSNASVTAIAITTNGTWTLGGTTTVAASSGTATFSGLTATSASSINGVSIDFTSSGLTHVVSNTFNIPAPAGITPPNLTAATGNTVDNNFNITFTNANNWQNNITSVKYGANTLVLNTDYTISDGVITLIPSGSSGSGLRTANGGTTLTVSATGFDDATVSQSIGVGAANKLGITTQPTAPASNGAVLATQPIVVIQDQYGNTTSSTATITVAINGTNAINAGTTSMAAVSGTASFSGVKAGTSDFSSVSSTLSFASDGLIGVTSSSFTIPAYSTSSSDYFRSKATGNWSSASTWESSPNNSIWFDANIVPGSGAASVNILNNVTINSAVVTNNITVNSGKKLILTTGGTLAINSTKTLTVDGILENAVFASASPFSGAIIVNGTFDLTAAPTASTASDATYIPTATWNTGSTCKISGIVGVQDADYTVLNGVNQAFYNFEINTPNLLGKLGLQNVSVFGSANTFIVNNTGIGTSLSSTPVRTGLQTSNSGPGRTGTTVTNYIQNGGLVHIVSNSSNTTGRSFTVTGNFTLNSGTFNVAQYTTAGATTSLTVRGDLTVGSGAILQKDLTSSGSGDFGTVSLIFDGTSVLSNAGIIRDFDAITVNAGKTLDMGNSTFGASNPVTCNGTANLSGVYSTLTLSGTSVATISDNTIISSLTVNSGGVLNIAAGKQLTLGTAFANNGTIHLKSDASGTATVLLPSNVSGTGAAIAEQYLATTRNWYISSPVSNAVAPAGYTYYQRDEAGSSWTSRPFVADSTFVRGRGYIALPGSEAAVITFSTETGGSLNTGDIPVYLTFAGTSSKGYNLIGNPYPSHLTWTKTFVDNNASLIEPSIYYRTTTGTANNQTGWSFKTINAITGEVSPLGTTNTIPPMQAFWIRAKATGTLTLNSDLTKSHNASNPLKAPATKNADRQRLRLQVDNGTATDEAVIYFDAAASDAYDRYDSPKFNEANTVTQIYTTAGTEKLVINGMHSLPLNQEIGLSFVPGSATAFSLRATELTNIPSDVRVILKDNVSKAETDLTDGVSVYEFAPATTTDNRFSVIFRTAGATTGFEKSIVPKAYVYVNANNQITINASEKSNYSIYNAVGQLMENGILNSQFIIHNSKLATGVYVVKVDNQSIRVVIK